MAETSREVTAIEHHLRGARIDTAPWARHRIEDLFGTILARITPDEVTLVEGARILCYLYLHEVERAKPSSASLQIALTSLKQLDGL